MQPSVCPRSFDRAVMGWCAEQGAGPGRLLSTSSSWRRHTVRGSRSRFRLGLSRRLGSTGESLDDSDSPATRIHSLGDSDPPATRIHSLGDSDPLSRRLGSTLSATRIHRQCSVCATRTVTRLAQLLSTGHSQSVAGRLGAAESAGPRSRRRVVPPWPRRRFRTVTVPGPRAATRLL